MSDDMTRALGIPGDLVKVKGKEYRMQRFSLVELKLVEKDCLERYKRRYLKTFYDNLDFLNEEERQKILVEEMRQKAAMDIGDLPKKFTTSRKRIKVTKELRNFIGDYFEKDYSKTPVEDVKAVAGTLIDKGVLSEKQYKTLTGKDAPREATPYVFWWMSGDVEGMITMVWASLQAHGVSREDVEEELKDDEGGLAVLAAKAEKLATPEPKNG